MSARRRRCNVGLQVMPVADAARWHFVSHMICENGLMFYRSSTFERSEDPAFMGLPDVRRKASFIRPTRKPSRDEILEPQWS